MRSAWWGGGGLALVAAFKEYQDEGLLSECGSHDEDAEYTVTVVVSRRIFRTVGALPESGMEDSVR